MPDTPLDPRHGGRTDDDESEVSHLPKVRKIARALDDPQAAVGLLKEDPDLHRTAMDVVEKPEKREALFRDLLLALRWGAVLAMAAQTVRRLGRTPKDLWKRGHVS